MEFFRLTASGHLIVDKTTVIPEGILPALWERCRIAFEDGTESGLLFLVTDAYDAKLPTNMAHWREFSRRYLSLACQASALTGDYAGVTPPTDLELARFIDSCPSLVGFEYLTPPILLEIWTRFDRFVRERIASENVGIQTFLSRKNPVWGQVGRVSFHLAENKQNQDHPFAFMATYVSRISTSGKPQHLPLGKALQEYAGANNRQALLALLSPIEKVSTQSDLIRVLFESGEIFRPLPWTSTQAFAFLKELSAFEAAGIVVRIPNWWKAGSAPQAKVSVSIGDTTPGRLGADRLLDFSVNISIDGVELSKAEWNELLKASDGLVRFKGQWVAVDQEKLQGVLNHWKSFEREVAHNGITFNQAVRLLSGFSQTGSTDPSDIKREEVAMWSAVKAGSWLEDHLRELNDVDRLKLHLDVSSHLIATLRPYQEKGLKWLYYLSSLGLGACLADDMGLGKTLQIIALILARRKQSSDGGPRVSLLILPASLIGNWKSEIAKFAPSLRVYIAHSSETHPSELANLSKKDLREEWLNRYDIVMTTYGNSMRMDWLADVEWDLVILDEAQAIKNPGTQQARSVKAIKGRARIALSGTPIENRLSDLWSLFDFLSPGLLGSAKEFGSYAKTVSKSEVQDFSALRRLVRPYILRRLKTDKDVIQDLPDKTEVSIGCSLVKEQAAHYQNAVDQLRESLKLADGIARRGIILAALMRFKQICNHPAQWMGSEDYDPKLSGKFARLKEICEELAARQEKVLIFTQFRELTEPLEEFLSGVFGRRGIVLSGETPIKLRQSLVNDFQKESGPPFFILSIKAGGTGLNLTAASHVIHFDRWWNPAVENQATDRAFRIGQKKNVMVHKFICKGTVEEKINALLEDKKKLSDEILENDVGVNSLMEMSNKQLMDFVALDINQAIAEDI